MEIVFKTTTGTTSWGDGWEDHEVIADGKTYMSQSDCIEPEDVRFYRNLSSPHDCDSLLKEVVKRVKAGEEITFTYEEVEEQN